MALVTGGIQGIGLGVCKAMACAGASIAVCDILSEDDPKTQKGISEIKKAGGVKVCYIKKDLAAQEQCYEVIDILIEEFGRLDIFVANAGITGKGNNWDAAYNVNVKSVYYCYEKAKQYLVQSQGRTVIISSASIFTGGTGIPEYIGSKGGTHAITRYIARECAPLGVRVNGVAPAVIMTEMTVTRFGSEQNMLSHYKGKLPLNRIGTIEDVANAVLYLASSMSNWTCGETLLLDGGRLYLGN